MKRLAGITLLPIFLLSGCNPLSTELSESVEVRIVPGSGIDGVRFGDSKEEVEAKLGAPDRGGIADGLYSAWFASDYVEGPHAGLSVYFLEDPINTAGPVDILTVRAPYSGQTREAIGIDSPVSDVRAAYGEPRTVYDRSRPESGVYTYVYCLDGKRLQIGFKENRVKGMGLGYYKSPPNNECR